MIWGVRDYDSGRLRDWGDVGFMAQGDLGIMVQRDLFVGGDLRRGQREPRRPLLLRLLRFRLQHERFNEGS